MKTLTMNGIQLYQRKNEYTVSIAASMTNMPVLAQLDNLKNLQDSFATVANISKIPHGEGITDKYRITYQIPMTAKSFLSLQQSNEILKLSVLNEVLKDNPLMKQTQYIPLIHPANIFMLDMKTIQYMYVDNGELYRSNKTPLEQYKALVISMLTQYSFEQMENQSVRQETMSKLSNMFLITVEKCKTVEELQALLNQRLNKIESTYFLYQDKENKRHKSKLQTLLFVLVGCSFVCMILLILILLRG